MPDNRSINKMPRMPIGVIGINHTIADLKWRELLAKACHHHFGSTHKSKLFITNQTHAFVVLCTCNRTEVYFTSPDLISTHRYILNTLQADMGVDCVQKLYSHFGTDCFFHLACVTAGLESAIIFETNIQRQVKMAYMSVLQQQTLPEAMHFLFQKSLSIAKKVRSTLHLRQGWLHLEYALLHAAQNVFKEVHTTRILFVGASKINQNIWVFLKKHHFTNITLCNRSAVKADELANHFKMNTLPWNCLDQWQEYDWVIFGTSADHYLITAASIVEKRLHCKLLIDLCVPRNIDPLIGNFTQLNLLNIDQIHSLLSKHNAITTLTMNQAQQCIWQTVQQHAELYQQKHLYRLINSAKPLLTELSFQGAHSLCM